MFSLLRNPGNRVAQGRGAHNLILDLRQNPGGLVRGSVDIARLFLDSSTDDPAAIFTVAGHFSHNSSFLKMCNGRNMCGCGSIRTALRLGNLNSVLFACFCMAAISSWQTLPQAA